MKDKKNKIRVFVGMSGGVDSSVSAALLKRDGHDVMGVFMKVWQPDWIECNWKEERLEAMRVAAHLDIPFVTLDLEKEYKEGVIDYMIREYAAGRTPNPDVMCNREVKFGAFCKWAIQQNRAKPREQGADYIATGHYARNEKSGDDTFRLHAGKDTNKDQSYFLWTLEQDDLKHILFPVGNLQKSEVRELAHKFKLPNADKKDSQGLCFIGKIDVKEFLRHYIKTQKGDVVNEKNRVIGHHPGALLLTIGERRGFTITEKTPSDAPYYVISKNMGANTITVSNSKEATGSSIETRITNANWIGCVPIVGQQLMARGRYRAPLHQVVVTSIDNGSASIKYPETRETPTPGQSLVIYDGDECLGGGIIV